LQKLTFHPYPRRFRISNFEFAGHAPEEPQRRREDTEENTENFSTGLDATVICPPILERNMSFECPPSYPQLEISTRSHESARRRRAKTRTGGSEERSRSEATLVSGRGRGRRPRAAGGHGDGKLTPRTEDGGSDSDHCGALGDGHLEVVAHAHRELGQRHAHIPLHLVTQLA